MRQILTAAALLPLLAWGAPSGFSQDAPVADILQSLPTGAGVCVHIGDDDGALLAELASKRPGLVIHALRREVRAARETIRKAGVAGQVTADRSTGTRLPYRKNLVNLLIVEAPGTLSEEEMVRVLSPQGTLWIKRDGKWSKKSKPRPREFGEWTHWRHGADGNMVSRDREVAIPSGVRWVAGPPQDKGGQRWYYDHAMVTQNGRNYYTYETMIVCRDAFNGVVLWTRDLKTRVFRETATPVPDGIKVRRRVSGRTSKVRPVVAGNRLYALSDGVLVALDTLTGKTVGELGAVDSPREILVDKGQVILGGKGAVKAFDARTGKMSWEKTFDTRRIVAGDGILFNLSKGSVIALGLVSGSERWKVDHPDAKVATTFTYGKGVLAVEKSTWQDEGKGCGILVLNGDDGKILWKKDYEPDMTHYTESRAYHARDLLWLQMEKSKLVGFDPRTGEAKTQWTTRGKHCATPVATDRFFIAPECDFTDLETGKRTMNRMFKSACRFPFLPANGLLYTFPVQCECFPMLRGYMGLMSGPRPEVDPVARHEKGKAELPADASKVLLKKADEWPMYRHDVYRSGTTGAKLKGPDLKRLWETNVADAAPERFATEWAGNPFVPGLVTPPVAAGGRLFVALPDRHELVAMDAATGKKQWAFTTGGRIDGPPTVVGDRCIVGSHDGWVYCLKAASGELLWRFRAAPRDERMMAYGQMESPWPVPASILVLGGTAYVSAGRHPQSDGGIRVMALDLATGKELWGKSIEDLPIGRWYGPRLKTKIKVGMDFEPIDMMVKDGERVAMSRWTFDPKSGDSKLVLGNVEYVVFGERRVPRGLWGYGIRQTKKVEIKPPAVFDRKKMYVGGKGDVAIVVAGGLRLTGTDRGALRVGDKTLKLSAAPVRDGMIVAYGRLYVSTRMGTVLCLE